MGNNKLKLWLPLIFSIVMIGGMFLGYKMKEKMPATARLFSADRKGTVQEVIDLISKRYVDSIQTDSLADAAIEEMLNHLDPHSIFIPATDLQEINEDLAGKFEGIGIEFNIFNDTINVITVLKGGPSERAGLQAGDKFLKIADSAVAGNKIDAEAVKHMLRGLGGSTVNVTMLRGTQTMNFTITRGIIPLYSLDAGYMIAPGTGYIRLNKFSETTYEEFMEAIQKLKEAGLQKLILDLRGNGGGILQESVEIADEFLDDNKLIVYTQGSHIKKQEFRARRSGIFEKGKLVVLVDEGSASASEVLTGALQDWDRAEVIGRRTFGKGLVQEQYSLNDGSALRLTIARYYTPLGRSIQKPYDKGIETYNEDLYNRYHNGAMINADSNKLVTEQIYHTAKGKLLYGGGGITPDIFVAMDTTGISNKIARLYARNTIGNFVYRYYVNHLDFFKKFTTPSQFEKDFNINKPIWDAFFTFASQDSVSVNALPDADKLYIERRLKSMFARQQWRNEGFFEVNNVNDPMVMKALEILEK
ncbi:MAG TPA: S41 family peptidase [Agriterribacter sp.]|nr:S41 family peptidase [Chitinophagaceae bacterium]HRP33840.1 S41 family peptidase [Agriterribacter sp.]